MTEPRVTLEQLEPTPAVTLEEGLPISLLEPDEMPGHEVTGSRGPGAAAVTRQGDFRWQTLIQECMGACSEISGVLSGFEEFSYLPSFPATKIHILDAGHDLRRALLHMEDAIKTLACEIAER